MPLLGEGLWGEGNGKFLSLHAQLLQSCLTLCDAMGCTTRTPPPGSSAHEILQARILEWVAMPFSRESSQLRDQICVSCIAGRFFTTKQPGNHRVPTQVQSCSYARWINSRHLLYMSVVHYACCTSKIVKRVAFMLNVLSMFFFFWKYKREQIKHLLNFEALTFLEATFIF